MENETPSPIVGAFILNDKNELLLFKCTKWKNLYSVPGGHVEYGETIEQAVKREIKEETNIDINFIEVFNVQDNIFDPNYIKKKHLIFLDCLCEPLTLDIKLDNRELIDWRWFKIDEVLSSEEVPNSVKEPVLKLIKKLKITMDENVR